MKTLYILFTISVLVFCSCSGERQDSNAIVFDGVVTPNLTGPSSGPFDLDESIGKDGNKIPLKLTWESSKDSSGCLVVTKLKVQRAGGDPKMIVTKVTPTAVDCAIDLYEESQRFQTVLVNVEVESRGTVPITSVKSPIIIRGDGKPPVKEASK